MIEVALNSGPDGIYQKDIAQNQDLSVKYLDQIIASLKAAGLIANVRGRKSGFSVAIPPKLPFTTYTVLLNREFVLSIACRKTMNVRKPMIVLHVIFGTF